MNHTFTRIHYRDMVNNKDMTLTTCTCGASLEIDDCDDKWSRIMEFESAHLSESKTIPELYQELIMAVQTKHPEETRHETALRYIRNAESHVEHVEVANG